MPVMNGVQLVDKIRNTSGWTHVPGLPLCGSFEAPDWVATERCARYIQKPVTIEALGKALEELAPRQPRVLPRRS
ncbi:MAG: hypothetical protein JO247_00010 [Chloroflexi bacterium]|nr:hypothetical protein [Chloroflexota bacterium]